MPAQEGYSEEESSQGALRQSRVNSLCTEYFWSDGMMEQVSISSMCVEMKGLIKQHIIVGIERGIVLNRPLMHGCMCT